LIRHLETGTGRALVHLQPANTLRLTRADELLSQSFRVIAIELPTSGDPLSSVSRLMQAVGTLGVDTFDLMSTSTASTAALALARQARDRVRALVLEAPAPLEPGGAASLSDLPTLIVFGTADTVVAPETGRALKEALPNAHLVFVYAAGHAIADDRPEALADVVGDFLERHEAFVVSRATTVIHP
jgi:pimeloyl-ACP methyl ester carboxylesterase